MIESFRPPEGGYTPEYWKGHSFEDDCPWKEWSRPKEVTDWGALRREYREAKRVGGMLLEAYRDLLMPYPIKTIREGDVFDAAQFAPGTLIRYEREYLSSLWSSKGIPRYGRLTYLGVVYPCEKDPRALNKRMIVYAAEGPFRRAEHSIFGPHVSSKLGNFRVGEVEHYRDVYGGLFNRWGRTRDQSIEKVNKVEILWYGEGVLLPAQQMQGLNLAPQAS